MATQVTLAGVPVLLPVRVTLTAGLSPDRLRVRVTPGDHRRLSAQAGPMTLRVAIDEAGADGGSPRWRERVIAGWRAVAQRRPSLTAVEWELEDARGGWEWARIVGRQANRLRDLDDTADNNEAPHEPGSVNPATGRAWTALELAVGLLREVGGASFAGATGIADNGAVVDDVRITSEADARREVARLLLAAGAAVAPTAGDGRFEVVARSADPTTALPADARPTADSPGFVRRPVPASARPGRVLIEFARRVELPARFDAPGEGDAAEAAGDATDTAIRLVNVIALPADEPAIAAWSRPAAALPAGAIVPIDDALAAWGLTDAVVREGWFADGLERRYAGRESAYAAVDQPFDPQRLARVTAIRRDYRRLFAIDPTMTQRIASWKPERASRLDPATGRPAPASVVAAVAIVPTQRPPAADALAAQNLPVGPVGGWRTVDRSAGLLRWLPSHGLAGGAAPAAIVPGTVVSAPPASLDAAGTTWATDAALTPGWRLETQISVTFADPGEGRVIEDVPVAGAAGPPVYRRVSGLSRRDGGSTPVNTRVIRRAAAGAASEATAAYDARPPVIGAARFAGLPIAALPAGATMLSIAVSSVGRVTTDLAVDG
jgi:hypothetical protein